MKGVSPLIAAVMLIVFTVLIAGILATFATSLTRQQIATAGDEALCIGSLDMSNLRYNQDTKEISFRLRNTVFGSNLTLRDFTITVEFASAGESQVYDTSDTEVSGLPATLRPAETAFVTIDANAKTSTPRSVEALAGNCPRTPAVLTIR